jgi:hypothetical protein
MSGFSPAGSATVTGSVTVAPATNPAVANVAAPSANTEYSFTFPANTLHFTLKSRKYGRLQLTYSAGNSGTIFLTAAPGTVYSVSSALVGGLTIYFQSTQASDTIEILTWQ